MNSAFGARAGSGLADGMHCLAGRCAPSGGSSVLASPGEQDVEAASEFGGAGGGRYGGRGYFVEPTVLTNTGPSLRRGDDLARGNLGLPLRTSVADGAC